MNDFKERRRGVAISSKQKEVMIEFLKRNPKVTSGKYNKEFTTRHARLIWQELTKILNGIPGATNSWIKWRKVWHDLHAKIRKKRRLLMCPDHVLATNGILKPAELTELELEVLRISTKEEDFSSQNNESNFIDINGFDNSGVDNNEVVIIQKMEEEDYGSPDEDETFETNPLDDISSEGSCTSVNYEKTEAKISKHFLGKTKRKKFINTQNTTKLNYLRKKLEIKKNYYDMKIKLMEKDVAMKQSILNTLEDISTKLSTTK